MKYVISWFERPQGSPIEYENAQKRILEVFGQWKAPANFKIEFFVIRVGEWGGHMLVECDDPVTIHKFCSMLPAFVFEVQPVIPVEEAVRGELEVIAWRDGLKRKSPRGGEKRGRPDGGAAGATGGRQGGGGRSGSLSCGSASQIVCP